MSRPAALVPTLGLSTCEPDDHIDEALPTDGGIDGAVDALDGGCEAVAPDRSFDGTAVLAYVDDHERLIRNPVVY